MSILSKKNSIYNKYKTINIARFVCEIFFMFSAMSLYLSLMSINKFFELNGGLFMGLTFISFVCSVFFEIKRLLIYIKIKNNEKRKLEKEKSESNV